MTEENKMQAIWNRIEDTVERLDNHTHGLAEMLLIMVLGGTVAAGFHIVLSVVVMGYVQLFSLITGAF
jgi:hypothetical protein